MRLKVLTAIFLIPVMWTSGFCGSDAGDRWGFGCRVFYFDIAPGTLGDVDSEFDQSASAELHAIYHATSSFSLELSAQYVKTGMAACYDDQCGDMGTLEQVPIFMTANLRFPVEKVNALLYLGAGIGYFINSFENEAHNDTNTFFALNQTVVNVEDSLGSVLSFGVEYQFTPTISLLFDVRCIFQKADIKIQSERGVVEDSSTPLNTSLFGLGLRYSF